MQVASYYIIKITTIIENILVIYDIWLSRYKELLRKGKLIDLKTT